MIKNQKLEELFNLACVNAARMFNESHEVLPMWHAVNGKNENVLIATPWSNDEEKEIAVEGLRAMFRAHQVKRYAFIVEAWTANVTHDVQNFRPSEHPDRREVLMITAEDRDGTQMMGWYFILRPEIGPPKLSEFHNQPFDGHAGRMVGLLS